MILRRDTQRYTRTSLTSCDLPLQRTSLTEVEGHDSMTGRFARLLVNLVDIDLRENVDITKNEVAKQTATPD